MVLRQPVCNDCVGGPGRRDARERLPPICQTGILSRLVSLSVSLTQKASLTMQVPGSHRAVLATETPYTLPDNTISENLGGIFSHPALSGMARECSNGWLGL